jgi:thymidylate synthase ThyX
MTGNLRNWLTVFHIRLKPDVQPETLEAMRAAFEIVEQLFPLTIRALQESGFLPVRE